MRVKNTKNKEKEMEDVAQCIWQKLCCLTMLANTRNSKPFKLRVLVHVSVVSLLLGGKFKELPVKNRKVQFVFSKKKALGNTVVTMQTKLLKADFRPLTGTH